jgi:hypothetical protein
MNSSTVAILAGLLVSCLGVLRMLEVPLAGIVGTLTFVLGVAACQALLFGGENPRAASIIGGGAILYLIMVVVSLTNDFGPRDFTRETTFSFSGFFVTSMVGGVLGYVVGGLIAFCFLARGRWNEMRSRTAHIRGDETNAQREDGGRAPSPPGGSGSAGPWYDNRR